MRLFPKVQSNVNECRFKGEHAGVPLRYLINIVPFALTTSDISILSRETPDAVILSNVKYATQKTRLKKFFFRKKSIDFKQKLRYNAILQGYILKGGFQSC